MAIEILDARTIDVKVKTLNSQNYDFSISDLMSVREFKEHIAETVSVQPDLQRIIYRGRILNDAMKLREYDMHGKVVHLVERPPPGPGSDSNNSDAPQVGGGGMNNNPTGIRRTVGSTFMPAGLRPEVLVGSMSVHANAPNGQSAAGAPGAPPSLNLSSTLCMNRITVARHMLQCAQNIINHIDNPSVVPLDNAPMDILVQETLDTTVVEVGISALSDVDQVQHIMSAFRGTVNAAFGPPSEDPNAPPTGEREERDSASPPSLNSSNASSSGSSLSSTFDDATIFIQSGEDGFPPAATITIGSPAPPPPNTAAASTGAEETNTNTPAAPSDPPQEPQVGNGEEASARQQQQQQTTNPRVLGEVVEEMRNVQRRLEPHLQRYYDILMNEPSYGPEDTTRREDDQREFDRVSEALHYISHAQHAISDLMLDLSTSSPRHLCCRPILIEHSAFLNRGMPTAGGSIFLPMGAQGAEIRMAGPTAIQFAMPMNGDPTGAAAPTAPPPPAPAGGGGAPGQPPRQAPPGGGGRGGRFGPHPPGFIPGHHPPGFIPGHHHHLATIPILVQQTTNGPPTMDGLQQTAAAAVAAAMNSAGIQELIQSIVNVAPSMATIEVQRGNEPPMTFNVPLREDQPQSQQPQQQQQTNAEQNNQTAGGNAPAAPPRTTSATTQPTTSTQTRSTARPQVHVASFQQNPSDLRGSRPFPPTSSSFDRFLPCNSHHVRENNRGGGAGSGGNVAQGVGGGPEGARIQIPIGFPMMPVRRRPTTRISREASRERPTAPTPPTDVLGAITNMPDINTDFVTSVREELHAWIVRKFFNNEEITVENIKEGISEIVISLEVFLEPISHFDHPHISIRMSVLELLRTHLREILNLLRKDDDDESDEAARAADERFDSNFIRSIRLFATTLTRILLQSNQRRQDIRQMFITMYHKYISTLDHRPIGRILMFFLKICSTALDTKFAANDADNFNQFLVHKRPSADESSPMEVEEPEATSTVSQSSNQEVSMDAQPSTSRSGHRNLVQRLRSDCEMEEETDVAALAPASWHSQVPSGWLSTLARDVDEQQRLPDSRAQPLSDAYLDGMTKKRRKTITDARPTGSIADSISSGVRQVIQSSGFQTTTPVDQIATQISSDVSLQSSYRESMNSSIRNRLQTDPNHDPKKYSNADKYFK